MHNLLLGNFDAILNMIAYFGMSIALLIAFIVAYTYTTPISEFALIKKYCDMPGYSLGGAILGFAIPMYQTIAQSGSMLEFLLWSMISFVLQIAVFFCIGLFFKKELTAAPNNTGLGILMGSISIAIGILISACMVA